MSSLGIIVACSLLYLVLIIVDAFRTRAVKRSIWQTLIWLGAILFAVLYFQQTTGRVSFGPSNRIVAIAVIFCTTVIGIAAHYLFYLAKPRLFNWFALLKPLLITPIVILPLVGSMQQSSVEPMQMVMLGLLAFQNGFFWRAVFEKAQSHARQ